jgi:hypothetical protein
MLSWQHHGREQSNKRIEADGGKLAETRFAASLLATAAHAQRYVATIAEVIGINYVRFWHRCRGKFYGYNY